MKLRAPLTLSLATALVPITVPQAAAQSFTLPLPPAGAEELAFSEMVMTAEPEARSALLGSDNDTLLEMNFLRMVETLCGVNDMEDVELYSGQLGASQKFVAAFEPTTAQIQWNDDLVDKFGDGAGNVSGVRWCTGSLIADNLFLTAGHCFEPSNNPFQWVTPSRIVDGVRVFLEPAEIVLNMHLNFRYQVAADTGEIREADVFPIEELLEMGPESGLDYAIVRVGPNAAGEMPNDVWGAREIAAVEPQDGALVTILQHPAGQPEKIEAGTETVFDGDFVTYADIDTLGGSSGSGVLNEDGEIVAVHTNGGCGPISGANLALSVRRIAETSEIID